MTKQSPASTRFTTRFSLLLVAAAACLLLLAQAQPAASAEAVTLAWDANIEDEVAGYKIHYATASATTPFAGTGLDQGASPIVLAAEDLADPAAPSFRLTGLTPGATYYLAVSAYNDAGLESDYSDTLTYKAPEPITHTITAEKSGSGTITPEGVTTILEGSSKTFSITPAESHHIASVVVDGIDVGPVGVYTFESISENHAIAATFAIDTFTVTANAHENGSIFPEGVTTADSGASVVLSIKPDNNCHIVDVLVDGRSVGAVDTYTIEKISRNHTIDAVIEKNSFTVTTSTSGMGSINPAGALIVEAGADQTFTFTPEAGHLVADVFVDGRSIGAVNTFTLSGVVENHNITAIFEANNTAFAMEVGEIMADANWQQVKFNKTFVRPVVVASSLSSNDMDPAVVRIDNVTVTGFEIAVQEWDYLDDVHGKEVIGYMVMEAGNHVLPDGTVVEAGILASSGESGFTQTSFMGRFPSAPVVLAGVATYNDPDAVTVRIGGISEDGFGYQLQEQEALKDGHPSETVAFIAWEACRTNVDGLQIQAGTTKNVVKHKWAELSFGQTFADAPIFIAAMQTRNGGDTCAVRWQNRTIGGIDVKVEEEKSADTEVYHTTEIVGYLAIAAEPPTDTDGDGLSDKEENDVYGTDPNASDSDNDGILDNDEVSFWGDGWSDDIDADGTYNLIDKDSDGDGVSDGLELANGSNPGVYESAVNNEIIPHEQLTIYSVDSEELTGEDGAAGNAIDGRSDTFWHTEWYRQDPDFPHEIVIDLGGTYEVSGVNYLPRQRGINGTVYSYEILVSRDAGTWGSPAAKGTFMPDASLKEVSFTGATGRYVKFRALSEINNGPWASAAEIEILGAPVSEPALIPQSELSIHSVDSEELEGEDGAAENTIDGLPETHWHTEWYRQDPDFPHEIVVDLGAIYQVSAINYLPRQRGMNGRIAGYEIFISRDGNAWGTPVTHGTFSEESGLRTLTFQETPGRFVRLVALSEQNGNPWASIAELNFIGR